VVDILGCLVQTPASFFEGAMILRPTRTQGYPWIDRTFVSNCFYMCGGVGEDSRRFCGAGTRCSWSCGPDHGNGTAQSSSADQPREDHPALPGRLPSSFGEGEMVGQMLQSVLAFVAATMIFGMIAGLALSYLFNVLAS
jgi:hypothetical protein